MEEKKYILSEEDIKKLPDEQQIAYKVFLDNVEKNCDFDSFQLKSFVEILKQQWKAGVLYHAISYNFPEILAKNINNIIDKIVKYRNDVIGEKFTFDRFKFLQIEGMLKVLKDTVEDELSYIGDSDPFGKDDLKSVLTRIEQIISQISLDAEFYGSFIQEKHYAVNNYKSKKEKYDKLSLFGKLAARINGQKKELDAAQKEASDYSIGRIELDPEATGIRKNNASYLQYIEDHQQEKTTGGMKR